MSAASSNARPDNKPKANDGVFEAKKSRIQGLVKLTQPRKRKTPCVRATVQPTPMKAPLDGQARRKAIEIVETAQARNVTTIVTTVAAAIAALSEGETGFALVAKSQTYASIKNSPNWMANKVAAETTSIWPIFTRDLMRNVIARYASNFFNQTSTNPIGSDCKFRLFIESYSNSQL